MLVYLTLKRPSNPDFFNLDQPSLKVLLMEAVFFKPLSSSWLLVLTVLGWQFWKPSFQMELIHHLFFPQYKDLDINGLKLICAQEMNFSSFCKIHMLPRTNDDVTVKSFMEALISAAARRTLSGNPCTSPLLTFTCSLQGWKGWPNGPKVQQ